MISGMIVAAPLNSIDRKGGSVGDTRGGTGGDVDFKGIFDGVRAEGIVYLRACSQTAGAKAMIETRIIKVVMVASLALFALLVTFDNLTDYDTNYAFVSHVLSMDTTSSGERSALSPHHLARAMAGRLCADHRGRGAVR